METKGMVIIGTSLLIIVLIFSSYRTPNVETTETEYAINPQVKTELLSSIIENECDRQNVDIELVYEIINSPQPNDGVVRYGLMKIHEDLVEKYNVNWSDGEGVIENVEANILSGIGRLKWAKANNASFEGMMMVYIYTKPEAQKMWADGIKTTKWVEEVKGEKQ